MLDLPYHNHGHTSKSLPCMLSNSVMFDKLAEDSKRMVWIVFWVMYVTLDTNNNVVDSSGDSKSIGSQHPWFIFLLETLCPWWMRLHRLHKAKPPSKHLGLTFYLTAVGKVIPPNFLLVGCWVGSSGLNRRFGTRGLNA